MLCPGTSQKNEDRNEDGVRWVDRFDSAGSLVHDVATAAGSRSPETASLNLPATEYGSHKRDSGVFHLYRIHSGLSEAELIKLLRIYLACPSTTGTH